MTDLLRKHLGGKYCVYCGSIADTKDHFPPKSCGNEGYLLPACNECNLLASTYFPTDFEKRANWVQDKLRFKYSRSLKFPDWTQEEIEKLGPSLKESVILALEVKNDTLKRLQWSPLAYLATLMS